jgi:hypothetical protein
MFAVLFAAVILLPLVLLVVDLARGSEPRHTRQPTR